MQLYHLGKHGARIRHVQLVMTNLMPFMTGSLVAKLIAFIILKIAAAKSVVETAIRHASTLFMRKHMPKDETVPVASDKTAANDSVEET